MTIKSQKVSKIPFALCAMLVACVLSAQTWGPDVRLTTSGYSATYPDLTVRSNNIHVVWTDTRNGNDEIYYKRSTNNGQNWTPGMRLSNDAAYSDHPAIACHDQNIHVLWQDNRTGVYEIFRRRSLDNGSTWNPSVAVTTSGHNSYVPSVAIQGDTIHVVWHDIRDGNYEIYYKRSTNNGQNWTPGIRLTNDTASSVVPKISCIGNHVHTVWDDDRHGNSEVYYKRSLNGGTSWLNDIRLTFTNTGISHPAIATFQNNVHIVWTDTRNGNDDIYYKRSTNNGTNWTLDMRLTTNGLNQNDPSIAVFGNNIHVVWRDERHTGLEIYYKYSSDNGNTWQPEVRLTNNPSLAKKPKVACTENNIHVVWYDNRNGISEIFYKHGTMPGAAEEQTPQNINHTYLSSSMQSGAVAITFQIPERSLVNLIIYDLTGKKVKTLANSAYDSGVHTVKWDGCADNGTHLASGIYFCRMQAGSFHDTEKLLLIK